MEKLVVRHRDGSVELAEGHSVEEALRRLAEYEATRPPPEDLSEVEENAYDLGYQAALRHNRRASLGAKLRSCSSTEASEALKSSSNS